MEGGNRQSDSITWLINRQTELDSLKDKEVSSTTDSSSDTVYNALQGHQFNDGVVLNASNHHATTDLMTTTCM